MPVLTFPCPKCTTAMHFDYADYDIKDSLKRSPYHYEKLTCNGCGKELITVPWVAVFDEETEEAVTFV